MLEKVRDCQVCEAIFFKHPFSPVCLRTKAREEMKEKKIHKCRPGLEGGDVWGRRRRRAKFP